MKMCNLGNLISASSYNGVKESGIMCTNVSEVIDKFKDFGKIAGIIGVIINGNAIFVVIHFDDFFEDFRFDRSLQYIK